MHDLQMGKMSIKGTLIASSTVELPVTTKACPATRIEGGIISGGSVCGGSTPLTCR